MSFLLRMDTARRGARVVSLLALDFAGVALAIFTALALKELVLGSPNATHAYDETKHFLPFAYLLTALLFARSGLYAARAQRPGLSRIVGSLFQVAGVALVFAVVSGEQFSKLLHILGFAGVRAAVRVLVAGGLRGGHGRGAVGRGIPSQGGAGGHGQAHPRRRAGARRGLAPRAAGRRRVPVAESVAGERAALPGLAGGPGRGAQNGADRRGDHRRFGLPRSRRSSSSTAATGGGCACGSRRERWRS